MQTKQGKHGILHKYKIAYDSWDPCQGQCIIHIWAYDKEHAQIKYQASFESDYELDNSTLREITRI